MYRVLHIPTGLWAHAFIVGRIPEKRVVMLFKEPTDFLLKPDTKEIVAYTLGYLVDFYETVPAEFEVINV